MVINKGCEWCFSDESLIKYAINGKYVNLCSECINEIKENERLKAVEKRLNEQNPSKTPFKPLHRGKDDFKTSYGRINVKKLDFKPLYLINEVLKNYPYISSFSNVKVCYGIKCVYSNGIGFKYCPFVLTASANLGESLKVYTNEDKKVKNEEVCL